MSSYRIDKSWECNAENIVNNVVITLVTDCN